MWASLALVMFWSAPPSVPLDRGAHLPAADPGPSAAMKIEHASELLLSIVMLAGSIEGAGLADSPLHSLRARHARALCASTGRPTPRALVGRRSGSGTSAVHDGPWELDATTSRAWPSVTARRSPGRRRLCGKGKRLRRQLGPGGWRCLVRNAAYPLFVSTCGCGIPQSLRPGSPPSRHGALPGHQPHQR